jgi:hypothetical protein
MGVGDSDWWKTITLTNPLLTFLKALLDGFHQIGYGLVERDEDP